MIKCGCNPNHRDKINETALFYAARDNRKEVCKVLLDGGAEINVVDDRKQTALFFAKKSASAELIDYLISRGAINTKDGRLTKTDMIKSGRPTTPSAQKSSTETKSQQQFETSEVLSENRKKKQGGPETQKTAYRIQITDENFVTRELTEADFERFKQIYPKFAELLLNQELLAKPEISSRLS